MAEIKFADVWKIYDKKVEAVKNLSFTCNEKEFFAILGPSGCGKTSSLRMLAGLEDISKGSVFIGGVRVNDLTPKQRNIAMSFENYGLYPDFTIFENIAYPLRLRKTPESQLQEQVLSIAKKLRLLDVLRAKPGALSSGQKQRVSIARALVRNPDVTIMDEPLSHLDAKMRSHMRSVIKSLHIDLGLTTIYVTHDQIEAMTMADKILIMNDGVAQQIGTPEAVYLKPENLFVAGFIGSPQMNLIECKVIQQDKLICDLGGAFQQELPQYRGLAFENTEYMLGVRPHDIQISSDPSEGFVRGTVYVVEPLGETTIISIKVGDTILKVETDGHLLDWHFDDVIYFRPIVEKCHLFNRATEQRIAPQEDEIL